MYGLGGKEPGSKIQDPGIRQQRVQYSRSRIQGSKIQGSRNKEQGFCNKLLLNTVSINLFSSRSCCWCFCLPFRSHAMTSLEYWASKSFNPPQLPLRLLPPLYIHPPPAHLVPIPALRAVTSPLLLIRLHPPPPQLIPIPRSPSFIYAKRPRGPAFRPGAPWVPPLSLSPPAFSLPSQLQPCPSFTLSFAPPTHPSSFCSYGGTKFWRFTFAGCRAPAKSCSCAGNR